MYDIIGDVHGCYDELLLLFEKLGYSINGEHIYHNDGYIPIFIGDLTDRGPKSVEVLSLANYLNKNKLALFVRGNHDDKLLRWANGKNVQQSHGLNMTTEQINKVDFDKSIITSLIGSFPFYIKINETIIAHASWDDSISNKDPFSNSCRSICLYGPTLGLNENGLPKRIDWASNRKPGTEVIYGHQVYDNVRIINNTYGIDTGCVFGNMLSAIRMNGNNREIYQVSALDKYYE